MILRIIQSVPSPKAEPIKLWLAQVGYERMQEMADPAIAIDRARALYKQHGRSDKWIEQRMMGQEARNKLTDYWSTHDVKQGLEYAILTNIIHQERSGLSVCPFPATEQDTGRQCDHHFPGIEKRPYRFEDGDAYIVDYQDYH